VIRILLRLFVINLGIAFGAGLYEHRIVVPTWIGATHWHPDIARRDDTGRRFWGGVTTLPLTLLTIVNLYAAWASSGPQRGWWLAASLAAAADRAVTFGYFIPVMVRLLATPDSPQAVALAQRWSALNWLRHALVLTAWLAALEALVLL
jgi:hypothetical protein